MAFMSYEHASSSFAWKASSFENPADYLVELTVEDRGELLAAVEALERSGRLSPVHALTKTDFRFDGLRKKLEHGYAGVRSGKGFLVLRGRPCEGLSSEPFTACAWGVGTHFGRALSQNAQGDLVTSVVDATAEDATPRMYRSNLELRPHSDITAMISLACWHKSASGGASIIVSGVTVHDEIRARAPHLLEALSRGYHYHRLGEEGPGEAAGTPYRAPVFANRTGQLPCRYQRAGIAAGQRERGVPLDECDLEALNLFDEIAAAPENRLAFFLERGDMIVINNYTVMHARTRFTNFPEPERQRRLVRLWFDVEDFRDVQEVWGQPVVVENRPGAGTVVGTDYVAKSAPDGHTLGMVVTAYVINPSLRSDLPYETLKDLTGVTQVSVQHLVMAANPSLPANSIPELIALAKKEPGKLAYATPGSGTAMHLSVELLKTNAGVDLVHVPYKGGAPAQQDVVAGHVPILMDVLYSGQPLIKAGKIKVLALLSPRRIRESPQYPVVAEAVPGVSALSLVGIVAPAATPRELVNRISADISRAVKSSDLTKRIKQQGMEPVGSTPAQFDALIRAEIEKWAKVVKQSGAKVD